jgi:tRNA threonylcarbamoyladenosine biosynthesis protein TsaE
MMLLPDAEATLAAGRALAGALKAGDVVTLSGNLGAGKTTFARGLLNGLGLMEEAPSPSFAIVLPYERPLVSLPVWHVDLYRLDNEDEISELGLTDVLDDGCLMIEWPERLGACGWPSALKISLDATGDVPRRLTVDIPPSWKERCPFQ